MQGLHFSQRKVFLDDSTDTVDLQLSWRFNSAYQVYIYYRKNGGSWIQDEPDYPKPFPDDPKAFETTGSRNYTANLGVIEVLATNLDYYQPNQTIKDPPPIGFDRCLVVKERGGTQLWDGRFFRDHGGTWVSYRCAKSQIDPVAKYDQRTFAVFEIGKSAPVAAAAEGPLANFMQFADEPILSDVSDYNFAHGSLIADRQLYPGNDFWGLVTLVNQVGDWNTIQFPFKTHSRKVVINFDELHIVNDGSEQHNDAEFRIWVSEGWQLPAACRIPELEISDRPSPGEEGMEHIKLKGPGRFPDPIVLGPKTIVPEQDDSTADGFDPSVGNELVAILAYGIAEGDGILDPHDRAANFDLPHVIGPIRPPQKRIYGFLDFPLGPDAEEVSNDDFLFNCKGQTDGNEFWFAVIGTYSVTYHII